MSALLLLILSLISFYHLLKFHYLYKKDILKRLPFYSFLLLLLALFIGLIFLLRLNYRIVLNPTRWDGGVILISLGISFFYIIFAHPARSIAEKIPFVQGLLPDKKINDFRSAHSGLKIERSVQQENFLSSDRTATDVEIERMRKRLCESSEAMEKVICLEKNKKLRERYYLTSGDLLTLRDLIDSFQDRVDYTRFIKEEILFRELAPDVDNMIMTFKRIIKLDY